jgi:hypothetical protein
MPLHEVDLWNETWLKGLPYTVQKIMQPKKDFEK